MRRRFSTSERAAMVIASGGVCELCGVALATGWHADHDVAFSRGGATDVANGQALCPTCNLKKGSGNVNEFKLRKWQRDFLRICNVDDFLLVACPGAGKTMAALHAVRTWWQPNSRVIVVVPTDHLKQQWSIAANKTIGVELSTMFENRNGVMPSDMAGIAVTYHQVASEPLVFRRLSTQRRTIVILDEIHHCGDEKSWGGAIREAFGVADRRLTLSGTPFRGDNSRIPFVEYRDGTSIAGFTYGYGRALRDGVCRDIQFPSFEGSMSWISRGKQYDASFSDDVPKEEVSRRLNTAIAAKSEWMRVLMTNAHQSLTAYRSDHPDAGGLILAKDTEHAEAIADVMGSIVDHRPVVVTSAHDDATKRIERFRDSREPWVVAVQMISEGVDIPRLRVLLYATNTKAELFFRQAIGRISRSTKRDRDDGGGFADCFIPNDPDLCQLASKIQEERNHVLQEEEESIRREFTEGNKSESSFVPLGASDAELAKVHSGGEEFSKEEMARAEDVRIKAGASSRTAAVEIARMLRVAGLLHVAPIETPSTPIPVVEDRQKLRHDLNVLVKRWAGAAHRSSGSTEKFDPRPYAKRAAMEPNGGYTPVAEATIAELKTAIAWVIRRMDEIL